MYLKNLAIHFLYVTIILKLTQLCKIPEKCRYCGSWAPLLETEFVKIQTEHSDYGLEFLLNVPINFLIDFYILLLYELIKLKPFPKMSGTSTHQNRRDVHIIFHRKQVHANVVNIGQACKELKFLNLFIIFYNG